MATINQLVRKPRSVKAAKATFQRWKPARRNVAYAPAYIPLPRKNQTPHCVKFAVRLTNGFEVTSYIGGEATTCRNTP